MVELLLTASHGHGYYPPPGLGTLQQGCCTNRLLPKDLNHFLLNQGSSINWTTYSHSIELSLQRKQELWSPGNSSRLLECNKFMMMDSIPRCRLPSNIQGTSQMEMLLFGFEVAKQCIRQESILKLLASGSIGKECSLQDLLYDLGSQQSLLQLPLQSCASSHSNWSFTDAESEWKSLAYPNPTRELYFNEHFLELGETGNCMGSIFHPDGQLMYNYAQLSAIPELQLSKTRMNKTSNLAMVVPYFERRRKARPKTDKPTIKTVTKVKNTKGQKKKTSARTINESEICYDSIVYSCDSLLSFIFDRRHPLSKLEIQSLKKSGQHILTDISANLLGAGVAVVLYAVYGVVCRGMPVCSTRLWGAGFGLALIWFSGTLNKLRHNLISVCKTGGTEKTMMAHLDRNAKELCFRAAALVVIAFGFVSTASGLV